MVPLNADEVLVHSASVVQTRQGKRPYQEVRGMIRTVWIFDLALRTARDIAEQRGKCRIAVEFPISPDDESEILLCVFRHLLHVLRLNPQDTVYADPHDTPNWNVTMPERVVRPP